MPRLCPFTDRWIDTSQKSEYGTLVGGSNCPGCGEQPVWFAGFRGEEIIGPKSRSEHFVVAHYIECLADSEWIADAL